MPIIQMGKLSTGACQRSHSEWRCGRSLGLALGSTSSLRCQCHRDGAPGSSHLNPVITCKLGIIGKNAVRAKSTQQCGWGRVSFISSGRFLKGGSHPHCDVQHCPFPPGVQDRHRLSWVLLEGGGAALQERPAQALPGASASTVRRGEVLCLHLCLHRPKCSCPGAEFSTTTEVEFKGTEPRQRGSAFCGLPGGFSAICP